MKVISVNSVRDRRKGNPKQPSIKVRCNNDVITFAYIRSLKSDMQLIKTSMRHKVRIKDFCLNDCFEPLKVNDQ